MAFDIKGGLGGGLGGAATGAALGSFLPGLGTAVGAGLGGLIGLFGGGQKQKNPKISAQSLLRPEQEPLYNQLIKSSMNPGAGGAFGQAADYYRNNLSDNPSDFSAFAAPTLRQYNQDILPNISEQFAGLGSGGLSSSGFRNAQVQGATDLAERLGALRASLRQSSAQGLQNIGRIGLSSFSENVRDMPQAGFGQNLAEGVGQSIPYLLSSFMNRPNSPGNRVGANTGPYTGGGGQSSPQIRPFGSPGQGSLLPSLNWR